MRMPGFTAEASVVPSKQRYRNGSTRYTNGDAGAVSAQRVVATYKRDGMYCMGIEDDDLQMSYEVCVDAITGAG